MKVNDLVREIHATACEKGWWDQPRTPLEIQMLIVSEVSEATEAVRNGDPHFHYNGEKPEGEAVELVDVVIRVMDYFGRMGWDMEAVIRDKIKYNKTRPHRHGGKRY